MVTPETEAFTEQRARIKHLADSIGKQVDFDFDCWPGLADKAILQFRVADLGDEIDGACPMSDKLLVSDLAKMTDEELTELIRKVSDSGPEKPNSGSSEKSDN
jgi:hypothetical protein